jgi:hypothetical protein
MNHGRYKAPVWEHSWNWVAISLKTWHVVEDNPATAFCAHRHTHLPPFENYFPTCSQRGTRKGAANPGAAHLGSERGW